MEIKFRYLDRFSKEWVYSDNSNRTKAGFWDDERADAVPGTTGQFTGLRDVENQEVYTKDIVKIRFYDEHQNLIAEETNIVDFDRAAFVFAPSEKHRGLSLDGFGNRYHWSYYEIEVIGNIFENPELLEVKWDKEAGECITSE